MIDWNQNMDEAPRDGNPVPRWMVRRGRGLGVGQVHLVQNAARPLYGFHATQGDPEYWDLVPLTHWAPD
jgi:hypothetical protein